MASLRTPPDDDSPARRRTWSWLLGWKGAEIPNYRSQNQSLSPSPLPPPATAKLPRVPEVHPPSSPIPRPSSERRQRPLTHCGFYGMPVYQPPVFLHSNRSAPLVGLMPVPPKSTLSDAPESGLSSEPPQHTPQANVTSSPKTQRTQSLDRTSKPLPELPSQQSSRSSLEDTPSDGLSNRVRKSTSLHKHRPTSPTLAIMLRKASSKPDAGMNRSIGETRRPASMPLQSGNHDFSIFRQSVGSEQIPLPQKHSSTSVVLAPPPPPVGRNDDKFPIETELFPDSQDFTCTKDTQYVSGGDWDFDGEEDSRCYAEAIGYDFDPEPSPEPGSPELPSPQFASAPTQDCDSDIPVPNITKKHDSYRLDFFTSHRDSIRCVPPSPTVSDRSSVRSNTTTIVHSEVAGSDGRSDSLGAYTYCETLSSWHQQLGQEPPRSKALSLGGTSEPGSGSDRHRKFPRRISSLSPVWFSWLEGQVADNEDEVEEIPRPVSTPITPPPRAYRSSQSLAIVQTRTPLRRHSYVAQRESMEVMSTTLRKNLGVLMYNFNLLLINSHAPGVAARRPVKSMLSIPGSSSMRYQRPRTAPSPQKILPPIVREKKEPKRKSKFWHTLLCTR
ncbi:hypothetical protein BZA05DRAFT_165591 [Tricharina praecox]|uniref:uncharacterized protein n=1 Tax=Tricharina praecox TaxID=43433 RepID=UPI00221FBB2E|nr:uncharacterized protein BZA05DRAFT_165591 [Tricharina praecox]KAI5857081.1 hypothetical protein BZA05DRAFT_165591 [Tricharina praecox]